MQTFLPYESFAESARALDMKRLGKQRVEVLQVMTCLLDQPTAKGGSYRGWRNHPAVRMWRGHELWLGGYQQAVCDEWVGRGYRDTCLEKTRALFVAAGYEERDALAQVPAWLGDPLLHESHRSNLLRKDPAHYAAMRDTTREGLEYVWPV